MSSGKEKKVKLEADVMVCPEETASMIRLFVGAKFTMRANQRPERRS